MNQPTQNSDTSGSIIKKHSFGWHGFVFMFVTLLAFALTDNINAQPPDDEAPPPLKLISKEETAALNAATGVKKRTEIAIKLMSARIKNAETLMNEEEHVEMFVQLGGFHALMDDTLDYLDRSDSNRSKVLNNFKKFEIELRKFRPRLELLRRELSSQHEPYVRLLIRYLREARSKAVEPLFSDRVVRQPRS